MSAFGPIGDAPIGSAGDDEKKWRRRPSDQTGRGYGTSGYGTGSYGGGAHPNQPVSDDTLTLDDKGTPLIIDDKGSRLATTSLGAGGKRVWELPEAQPSEPQVVSAALEGSVEIVGTTAAEFPVQMPSEGIVSSRVTIETKVVGVAPARDEPLAVKVAELRRALDRMPDVPAWVYVRSCEAHEQMLVAKTAIEELCRRAHKINAAMYPDDGLTDEQKRDLVELLETILAQLKGPRLYPGFLQVLARQGGSFLSGCCTGFVGNDMYNGFDRLHHLIEFLRTMHGG